MSIRKVTDEINLRRYSRAAQIKGKINLSNSVPAKSLDDTGDNLLLLQRCENYWNALSTFRARAMRSFKYYRGEQWSDAMEDPENAGQFITEGEWIARQGQVPLKNNQIRQLINNIIGQYRSAPTKTIAVARAKEKAKEQEMMTNALQYALGINMTNELDARMFESFLMSGHASQKIRFKNWKERNIDDLFIENTNLFNQFWNTNISDPRMHDLKLIGEFHDYSVDEIITIYAKTRADEKRILEYYSSPSNTSDLSDMAQRMDRRQLMNNFLTPNDMDKRRVYEIYAIRTDWRIKVWDPTALSFTILSGKGAESEVKRENENRLRIGAQQGLSPEETPLLTFTEFKEPYWYCKHLTSSGQALWEGETPYAHEEHPYILMLHPLLNHEVWGLVEDIIDQQRAINRSMIMMDMMIGASAKGVLVVDEEAVNANKMDLAEIASAWTAHNGVVTIKLTKGQNIDSVIKQFNGQAHMAGLSEYLQVQMNLIQQISGVGPSIQGQRAPSGTPASLYAQESQNASMNTMDKVKSFNSFIQRRDLKAMKVIKQFYKEERYLAVTGKTYTDAIKVYEPKLVQDVEFDTVLTQSVDTPVYRNAIDSLLMDLLKSQMINLKMFLKNTSLPFAEQMLQQIEQEEEKAAQGGTPDMAAIQQAAGQGDPKAVELLQKMMGGQQNAA
ncbi:MAG: hypothetical protein A2W93_14245 [Bacteroidetes bacterium GWF2_43_63]|nr:MAG: hypothetical protein A2W94_00815 [Bacteroidetes bacterium GWE2_42_42]OFY52501.1 MAG: hypothetical protein A2W93_14245 [Bacteroidetes bacterium GWF2_43_63]HBG71408.1 hypothetical protein [Bacteroidales bacterium]HCB60840.1 hypothetical protein [Bacteroidales bacterium]HCY23435.1 hypothetical protein [Bacteroidales bacterium]